MKTILKDQKYDTRLETSDWRYSAAIIGLIRYFEFHKIPYNCPKNVDYIEYNSVDITEEQYLKFVEQYFSNDMHHKVVEKILQKETVLSPEEIDIVEKKLKANKLMKSIFSKIKYSEENKTDILEKINENRLYLIKETYRKKKNLYANFSNENSLFLDRKKICRLKGYYVDQDRKINTLSFGFNDTNFVFEDDLLFDFIPFAFSKANDAIFINNNFSVHQLKRSNTRMREEKNTWFALLSIIKESVDFLKYDVEIILKNRDREFFETIFIRKKSIPIIQKIKEINLITYRHRMNDNYSIDFGKEVLDGILNFKRIDGLIELLLKIRGGEHIARIKQLIEINTMIYKEGVVDVTEQMKSAYKCAKLVLSKIPENKVESYKQKLLSSVIFNDKDRVFEILLQLSSYSGVAFNFAYDLFSDYETNKNLIYTFINALNKGYKEVDQNEEK